MRTSLTFLFSLARSSPDQRTELSVSTGQSSAKRHRLFVYRMMIAVANEVIRSLDEIEPHSVALLMFIQVWLNERERKTYVEIKQDRTSNIVVQTSSATAYDVCFKRTDNSVLRFIFLLPLLLPLLLRLWHCWSNRRWHCIRNERDRDRERESERERTLWLRPFSFFCCCRSLYSFWQTELGSDRSRKSASQHTEFLSTGKSPRLTLAHLQHGHIFLSTSVDVLLQFG